MLQNMGSNPKVMGDKGRHFLDSDGLLISLVAVWKPISSGLDLAWFCTGVAFSSDFCSQLEQLFFRSSMRLQDCGVLYLFLALVAAFVELLLQ